MKLSNIFKKKEKEKNNNKRFLVLMLTLSAAIAVSENINDYELTKDIFDEKFVSYSDDDLVDMNFHKGVIEDEKMRKIKQLKEEREKKLRESKKENSSERFKEIQNKKTDENIKNSLNIESRIEKIVKAKKLSSEDLNDVDNIIDTILHKDFVFEDNKSKVENNNVVESNQQVKRKLKR